MMLRQTKQADDKFAEAVAAGLLPYLYHHLEGDKNESNL